MRDWRNFAKFGMLVTLAIFPRFGFSAVSVPKRPLYGTSVCTKNEKWSKKQFTSSPESFLKFKRFLAGEVKPVLAFSQGLAFRSLTSRSDLKVFAEYWVSRSLVEAKMIHIAVKGFLSILKRETNEANAGVQLAALGCLVEIQKQYPSLSIPQEIVNHLPELAKVEKKFGPTPVVWAAAEVFFLQEMAQEKVSHPRVTLMLNLLQKSVGYQDFVAGLWWLNQNQPKKSIKHFINFINNIDKIPTGLKRYTDTVYLLLGRAYYQIRQFQHAIRIFRKIGKSSNELVRSLSDLSWSLLLEEQYPEAVGTAMNLQVGALRRTFAPESLMVMAMALNELCQYPESLRAINLFKKFYEEPYRWLQKKVGPAQSESPEGSEYYKYAIKYLRREKPKVGEKTVPEKILSEWVKSASFQSHQIELNLMIDENDHSSQLSRSGSIEQKSIALTILDSIRSIKPAIIHFKKNRAKGVSEKLKEDVRRLYHLVESFEDLQNAAPVWGAMLASYRSSLPGRENRVFHAIHREMDLLNRYMAKEIEKVAENVQLIEVEIFNGASQDMIWQNAHPEYKEVARDLARQDDSRARESTWHWGKINATLEEDSEVWEDELGAFKSNLYDNCSNKERFLALKFKKGKNKK